MILQELNKETDGAVAQERLVRLSDAEKYADPSGPRRMIGCSQERVEEQLRIALDGHPESELWGENGLIAATMRCVDALDAVTEQRDRLAEVLLALRNNESFHIGGAAYEIVEQALQSLNQPTEP